MKNLLLAYNPYSGSKTFVNDIDPCVEIFQRNGFLVKLFRFDHYMTLDSYLSTIEKDYFHTIVASGGDGTINIVLNAIMLNGIKANLGILPSGTANDFASFLEIEKNSVKAAEIIVRQNILKADIGIANDRHFINVFAGGLFTNVSHQVDKDFKPLLGKLAYYIKGIEQIPTFMPIPVRVTNSVETFEVEIILFLVLNSSGTGGFSNLAKGALINDGKFDFIAIKARPIVEIAVLFVKILTGDYLDDPNVIYFQDSYIKVESLCNDPLCSGTDIDGEIGPDLPVEVKNLSKIIDIIVP